MLHLLSALLLGSAQAQEPAPPPLIIAHRGGADLAPENTMAAFRDAAARGVGFELDVALSADGHVVVLHDDTLDRTTTGTGPVEARTLAELQALDAGSWYSSDYAGEALPTLIEVLEELGGEVLIDIEIKSTTPIEPLVDGVVAAVQAAGVEEHVIITSFNPYMLERVKLQDPSLRRGQLTGTFKDADLNAVEKLVLKRMWLNGKSAPDVIAIEHVRVSRRFCRKMHKQGLEVWVWTVNDPEQMLTLREAGVDAFITDRPDLMLQAL